MAQFERTHSLTLFGSGACDVRIVLLTRKRPSQPLPCRCLRLEEADFAAAIAIAEAELGEDFNIAVAIAKRGVSDWQVARQVEFALAAA